MRYWFSILLFISFQGFANNSEEKKWWEYIDGSVKIKFRFKEILNHQFLVEGVWTPQGGEPGHAGPAELVLKDIHNGSKANINIRYFSLGFDDFEGLDIVLRKGDDFYYNPNVNLDKTYLVNYYDLDRMSLWNYKHQWYPQPIFFEDINFDDKKELIALDWMGGQRFNHEYEIYQITTLDNQTQLTPYYPTKEAIDSSTEFDRTNKTIRTWHSGGTCSYSNYKYQYDGQKYRFVEYIKAEVLDWDTKAQRCHRLVYDIWDGEKVLRERYSQWH